MRLDLKTGFACNNRCSFCVQGDRRVHLRHRPVTELAALLTRHAGDRDEVVFTGGECTLHPQFIALVKLAVELGYRVQVQSNGRRFSDPAFAQACVDAGVHEYCLAVHGARPATHDEQTRARGSWRQTVTGIRWLVTRGHRVITNSVVTKRNLHELPALVMLLHELGVRSGQLAMVHPLGSALEDFDEVVPSLPEAAFPVRRALATARVLGLDLVVEALPACFLEGWEDCIAELRMPATHIEDPDHVVPDYKAARLAEGKAKGPPCETCSWDTTCEGPWREYPEHHGWEGVKPRRDSPFD